MKNFIDNFDTVGPIDMKSAEEYEVIDIRLLLVLLWRGRVLIGCSMLIVFISALLVAIGSKDIYESSVLLAPASESKGGGLSGLSGQLGGIASLAGINLSSGGSETTTNIAVLKSRLFVNAFIEKYDLKPHLFPDSWDENKRAWRGPTGFKRLKMMILGGLEENLSYEPSDWDSYKLFRDKVLNVSENTETGLVTLKVTTGSPVQAQDWAMKLVSELNEKVRLEEMAEAEQSISYLQKNLKETSLANMQAVLYQLVEGQMKTMMLANIRTDFAFKVIDPAVVPQEKVGPKRTLIVGSGLVFGFIFGAVIVLLKSLVYVNSKTQS